MNKIHNIILGVLGLAVAILFFLHFKNTKSTPINLNPKSGDIAAAQASNVVFINTDTFFAKYDTYKKIEKELKAAQASSEKNLGLKMKAIEKDYMNLMQQAQAGQVNPQQAQAKEKEIMNRKNALDKESQTLMKSLADKSDNATKELYKTLKEYFEENKEKYNADFVMGYQTNGMILYFDPSKDITNEVVADLNK